MLKMAMLMVFTCLFAISVYHCLSLVNSYSEFVQLHEQV